MTGCDDIHVGSLTLHAHKAEDIRVWHMFTSQIRQRNAACQVCPSRKVTSITDACAPQVCLLRNAHAHCQRLAQSND
jgi:hypothetical protein